LDVLVISSTERRGSNTAGLDDVWKFFYSGGESAKVVQAVVGILASPQLASCVDELIPLGGKLCMLRLYFLDHYLCLIRVYAPNPSALYPAFVE